MVFVKEFYDKNKKVIDRLFKLFYIVVFIGLAVFVGNKHEHWADEAQSWLIARDLSFVDIIKYIRYEGTPPLWHFILKIAILCGLKYNQLIYFTTFFSVIGIIILFKNKKIPLLVKILLPYTYFIFFQYTIVARSYVLIFPMLMYILYIYPEKEKKLLKYGITLSIFMNISSHTFLLAGGLWLEFLVQEIKKYKQTHQKELSKILFFSIIAVMFILVTIMVFPASDCGYKTGSAINIYRIISEAFFSSCDNSIIYKIGVILFFVICSTIVINFDNILKVFILIFPNLLWITCINGSAWHIGIIFLNMIFVIALIDSFKNIRFVYFLLIFSMILQIYWSVRCSINDINNKYSVGEDVRNYLVEIGYEDKEIVGVDYWSTQVNSYFDKNIYCNFDYAFSNWKNAYFNKIEAKQFIKSKKMYDVYIIPFYEFKYNKYENIFFNRSTYYEYELLKKLYESGEYTYKFFDGNMYFKDKIYETTGLYVFVKKDKEDF